MEKVNVRYGPSPTGIPHIGNIRTALFNYLIAKNTNGKFYLRIEDTDQKRLVKGAVEKIQESLKLLGLDWDGDVIFQSKRLEIYSKHLDILKTKGVVYEDEGAWRFKINTKKTKEGWDDIVHGRVEFPTNVIEDFIIVKSDGYPTYHFASVVDDHLMEITHVLRGDEWISSTPKHLQLYDAFGWDPPHFVHLPVILGPNKKKLSKREGAKTVHEFIDEGYLPEALVNFLALLGWAPKSNQEIFSLADLAKEFSLDRINKNSPIFNLEKLDWFNGQWIRKMTDDEIAKKIQAKNPDYPLKSINEYIPIVKDRMQYLSDFDKLAGPYMTDTVTVDPGKVVLPAGELQSFVDEYKKINEWSKTNITSGTISIMEKFNLSKSEALGSIGTSISGSNVTPPLFDTLEKLGKDKTIKRLENVIEKKQK